MSLPKYREHKDSGFSWLGTVPSHWPIKRLRYVANLNPSKSEIAGYHRSTAVSFLPMESIGDDGSLSLDRTRTIAEVETGYTYFRDGDVTLAKITPCFENGKGALMQGLREGIGFGTTELIVARPNSSEVLGSMLNWIFRSPNFRKQGEASMYGAGGQKRVPDDFVRDFAWALPPIDEQVAIAAFLDRETAKIGALIAEQEKLIALLAEKRQATVSHFATAGLHPNVTKKDSGIEWLGKVPEHWEIKRVKHIKASVPNAFVDGPFGSNLKSEHFIEDGDVFVIESNFATQNQIDEMQLKKISLSHFETIERSEVVVDDIVIAKIGAQFGKASILPGLSRRAVVSGNSLKLTVNKSICAVKWIHLQLVNLKTSGEIDLLANGSAQPALSLGAMNNLPILLPPLSEQIELVSFVEAEIHKVDVLNNEAERAISLLKERRSALIAAAVTGKIDVRGAVSQAAAQSPEAIAA